MISKGISNDVIKIQSFGEEQPTATNDNEIGKQKNRRVEIVVEYKEQTFSANRKYIQTFRRSPQTEMVINGKKGTIVRIPPNSFVDSDGKIVKSEVTIELIEIYTKSDMILNNVQTISDQELLETGGMIYIVATSQNGKLELKKNSFYTVKFPTDKKQKDMNIFYGDTTSANINWQQADKNFQSDATYIENEKEVNKYIFNPTRFGWINCDRFIGKTETTNLIVDASDAFRVNFYLVFKDIKSIMNVEIQNNVIQFRNVPIGRTATIVAFKKTDQETLYSSKTVKIKENQTVSIIMEKITDEEFTNRMKQFD